MKLYVVKWILSNIFSKIRSSILNLPKAKFDYLYNTILKHNKPMRKWCECHRFHYIICSFLSWCHLCIIFIVESANKDIRSEAHEWCMPACLDNKRKRHEFILIVIELLFFAQHLILGHRLSNTEHQTNMITEDHSQREE